MKDVLRFKLVHHAYCEECLKWDSYEVFLLWYIYLLTAVG